MLCMSEVYSYEHTCNDESQHICTIDEMLLHVLYHLFWLETSMQSC